MRLNKTDVYACEPHRTTLAPGSASHTNERLGDFDFFRPQHTTFSRHSAFEGLLSPGMKAARHLGTLFCGLSRWTPGTI